jgi:hypothetical protein
MVSPQQISARLRIEFPGDPMMRVSDQTIETIYQALYVQAAASCAASCAASWPAACGPDVVGGAKRRPRGRVQNTGQLREAPRHGDDRPTAR